MAGEHFNLGISFVSLLNYVYIINSRILCLKIVERQKTPQEMREEYERIQKMRAQFRLEERTHPKVIETAA